MFCIYSSMHHCIAGRINGRLNGLGRKAMTFGEKLKTVRTKAGLKQSDLAKKLKTTANTVSNWETNVCKPDLDMLSSICRTLQVSPAYFLGSVPDQQMSLTEQGLVKKYRELDSHGQEMVDFTLQKEWERSVALRKAHEGTAPATAPISFSGGNVFVNAAHAEDYANAPEELKRQEEAIMDDDDF